MIEVIVPAWEAEATLGEMLESLPAGVRVTVVDDGSTDATAKVAREHGARVVSVAHAGPYAARLEGIRRATAEWVMFADADDVLCEGAVEALLEEAFRNPEADVIVGNIRVGEERLMKPRKPFVLTPNKYIQKSINEPVLRSMCGKIIRREALCSALQELESLMPVPSLDEDQLMMAVIMRHARGAVVVPTVDTYIYRLGGEGQCHGGVLWADDIRRLIALKEHVIDPSARLARSLLDTIYSTLIVRGIDISPLRADIARLLRRAGYVPLRLAAMMQSRRLRSLVARRHREIEAPRRPYNEITIETSTPDDEALRRAQEVIDSDFNRIRLTVRGNRTGFPQDPRIHYEN